MNTTSVPRPPLPTFVWLAISASLKVAACSVCWFLSVTNCDPRARLASARGAEAGKEGRGGSLDGEGREDHSMLNTTMRIS